MYSLSVIRRHRLRSSIRAALARSPVVALLGPRQCGKTTLAHELAGRSSGQYLDLESERDLRRLDPPDLALEPLRGLVVIDEIQRRPDLFQHLRVLADRKGTPAQFLILGSASPDLVRGVSETLAGRVAYVDMSGFDIVETRPASFRTLWTRGGFPRSFLARSESASFEWREDFVRSFLEREIPQLGFSIPAATLRRFWTMIAHFHGQIWNAAEFARSLGASESSARRYLDLLTGAYVVRQLQPWFENVGKRLVKSPKVYVRDSGLLHALLLLRTATEVASHPRHGASWEGFVVEQVLSLLGEREGWFYRTHAGAELDLLIVRGGKRFGFEIKLTDGPSMTKSMHVAHEDLHLERLFVIYPGPKSWSMGTKTEAVSILDLPAKLKGLK
ncbi:MAG: ATPase [Planctomycetota bacterium]|nr:MAG: ATPase [Planctomycetota bacterium]